MLPCAVTYQSQRRDQNSCQPCRKSARKLRTLTAGKSALIRPMISAARAKDSALNASTQPGLMIVTSRPARAGPAIFVVLSALRCNAVACLIIGRGTSVLMVP